MEVITKKKRKLEKIEVVNVEPTVKKRKIKKKKKPKKKKKEKKIDKQSNIHIEPIIEQKNGRLYTVSIALPSSIIENAQSAELQTYLVGQIARAATIFNIDEIVIIDNANTSNNNLVTSKNKDKQSTYWKNFNATEFFEMLLNYLETPQYLRKALFPVHHYLRFIGLTNPLDSPHHMRQDEIFEYREGVVAKRPVKDSSFIDIGLKKQAKINTVLPENTRITLKLKLEDLQNPKHKRGYDLTIGTSENGKNSEKLNMPFFKHLLIVFGGVEGLEPFLNTDKTLDNKSNFDNVFDAYVNTCPNQGSRTIRTEEAILVSLADLQKKIEDRGFTN